MYEIRMLTSIRLMNLDRLVGQTIGTAVLLRILDYGAMSVVFVAFQKTLKRQIAVKILPTELLTPQAADFFQQEAESAAFLSHPCIIPIYEIGRTPDFLFFTMQLIKGYSLAQALAKARRNPLPSRKLLPVAQSLTIMVKILDALDYAHAKGIVHRDIKPGNILIDSESQRPVVSDFGVARSYSSTAEGSRMLVGTPTYMAPEQILSSIVDGQADVYAAGVMLFEMLVGDLPYPPFDSARKLLKIKLRLQDRLFQQKPSALNPAVDPELEAIVLKAVAHDKQRRYTTCRDFARDLEAYLAAMKTRT